MGERGFPAWVKSDDVDAGSDLLPSSPRRRCVADERTNENTNRKRSHEYWYSNVSAETPREYFSLFLSVYQYNVRTFLSSRTFGRRGETLRARFRFNSLFSLFPFFPFFFVFSFSYTYVYTVSPLIDLTSLILLFSVHLVYAFLRVVLLPYPVSFYTITHAFTRAPSYRDLERTLSPSSRNDPWESTLTSMERMRMCVG